MKHFTTVAQTRTWTFCNKNIAWFHQICLLWEHRQPRSAPLMSFGVRLYCRSIWNWTFRREQKVTVQPLPKVKWRFQSLKGQCHDIQWFFALFFCVSKQWWLLAQMSQTSDHGSLVSRANNFTAQARSSKYRFLRPCLVAAIIFPHTKWLPKITDYRDTAALRQDPLDLSFWSFFTFLHHGIEKSREASSVKIS